MRNEMTEKLPAYIISQRRPSGRQFVIGTREPVFIAEIKQVVNESEAEYYEYRCLFNDIYYCFQFKKLQGIGEIRDAEEANKRDRYFKRAVDYYLHNHLKTNEYTR